MNLCFFVLFVCVLDMLLFLCVLLCVLDMFFFLCVLDTLSIFLLQKRNLILLLVGAELNHSLSDALQDREEQIHFIDLLDVLAHTLRPLVPSAGFRVRVGGNDSHLTRSLLHHWLQGP